jgi:hypothetical protein
MLQQTRRTIQSKVEEVPSDKGSVIEEDLTVNSYYLPTDKLFLILEFV